MRTSQSRRSVEALARYSCSVEDVDNLLADLALGLTAAHLPQGG